MDTYSHFARTANYWAVGLGKTTALRSLRKSCGSFYLRTHGHEILEFSRELTVDEILVAPGDGALEVPEGVTAMRVELVTP